ncbi:MAG TPA: 16S rRNA (cytidine(1402)-2'-O)-methyltransferase, partial [Pseudolysinimonas sp.]|nr:16S rRNA (cytidine(1402)-2'-O)-methyltransferase [Pseudolysinimonas sp.]
RELSKLHEEVRRGTLAQLASWAADGVRGEIVLVVAGAEDGPADPASAIERVRTLVAGGARLKDASAQVAAETGLPRRELYDGALAARSGG